MQWLDARPTPRVDFAWLSEFEYDGQRVPLMDRQRGIRKPAGMKAALSIRTTFTPPGHTPPYADADGSDGLQRYKYRGDDPDHRRTSPFVAPRAGCRSSGSSASLRPLRADLPGVGRRRRPRDLEFALALDEGQRFVTPGAS